MRITSGVRVILPKKSQTILDAPLGYIGLYTHHFSLSNLRLPIPPFICYRGEPSVDLLLYFLNLGPAGSFFFIENKIIPSDYPELLLGKNKLDKKSFKDKVPLHPEMDPLYDQIATYPCIVQTFPDPILYLAGLKTTWEHSPKKPVIYHRGHEMDFRSFMLGGVDGELNFLPAKNVVDSDDPSYREDEQTLISPSLSPHLEAMPARASKVAGEASTPLDVDSNSDIHEFPSAKELKDATDCHWVVAHVTPPSWKQHLREISIEQLCDIHDRAYIRQAVLDNVLNNRTRELISALHKAKTSYDAIRAREPEKDRAYAELERKCNEALQDLDKNPLVSDMLDEIKALQGQVDGLHSEYGRIILEDKIWVNYEHTLSSLQAKIKDIESKRERLKSSEIQLL
ncbi:hypothetical protein Tco_0855802 [Tanacetum coccineum]